MERSQHIVKMIETDILEGRLPVGQRLASEGSLCEHYGASRTLVREALQQLRGRGLLRTVKGSGTYIAESNIDHLSSAMAAYSARADDVGFLELIDFRILIESECARMAARNAGRAAIRDLRDILEQMNAMKTDRKDFSRLDIAFHLTIAKASGNSIYSAVLRALEKKCINFARENRGEKDWHKLLMQQHTEILKAIETANADEAGEAMRSHLLNSRRLFVDQIRQ